MGLKQALKMLKPIRSQAGYTLLELLIVLIVIGVLVAILIIWH